MTVPLGVVFPQVETTGGVAAIDAYIAAVVDLGYDHLVAYDHVVGADVTDRQPFPGPYTHADPFHEPFTLFAYLAATSPLGLMTGVLVLPQRQTVLVAKQAAQVDMLAPGRFRLGVGIGWNEVEYEALGVDFARRGRRMEEQVCLLRRLWSEPVVTFEGEFDTVRAAGILPRPARPVPVWIGAGASRPALERVGRIADGFIPMRVPGRGLDEALAVVRSAAHAAGRDPDGIGMQARVPVGHRDADRTAELAHRWLAAGATHLAVDTMGAGLAFPDGHVAALRDAAAVLGAGS